MPPWTFSRLCVALSAERYLWMEAEVPRWGSYRITTSLDQASPGAARGYGSPWTLMLSMSFCSRAHCLSQKLRWLLVPTSAAPGMMMERCVVLWTKRRKRYYLHMWVSASTADNGEGYSNTSDHQNVVAHKGKLSCPRKTPCYALPPCRTSVVQTNSMSLLRVLEAIQDALDHFVLHLWRPVAL